MRRIVRLGIRSFLPAALLASSLAAYAGSAAVLDPSPSAANSSSQKIAQDQPATQPIATGSPSEKMDAGASNKEEEGYRHSSTVQALARVLHLPVERTAQIFEDFNSGLLILVIVYFLAKYLPKAFRGRRETIEKELGDARSATELARTRLEAIEARLAGLDGEIEAIRKHAEQDSVGDQKRIEESLEVERARIIRSAEQEIGAAQAAAQRELKRFAADLAVERAMSRIELSADADRVLVNEFTENLGSMIHPGDFAKRGQN